MWSYWKLITHTDGITAHNDTQKWYFLFICAHIKNDHVTEMYHDDKRLKIASKHCYWYVILTWKIVELIHIKFIHAGISTLGI